MNLWRRSKSWFQESFPSQKENFEPQDYLEQEKQLLKAKYAQERAIIEKQFHYEMLEAKLRFENELRRLQDEHSRLKAKSRQESEEHCIEDSKESPKKTLVNEFRNSATKNPAENGFDGLEWDPINELKSYTEEELSSWDPQSEISPNDSFEQDEQNKTESRDSAYGSISMELQRSSFTEDGIVQATMRRFKASEVERKIEQLRNNIRQEIARGYDEKFQAERKFLYSVIDELEENVALLRKQKEDIVTIFEAEGKDTVDKEES